MTTERNDEIFKAMIEGRSSTVWPEMRHAIDIQSDDVLEALKNTLKSFGIESGVRFSFELHDCYIFAKENLCRGAESYIPSKEGLDMRVLSPKDAEEASGAKLSLYEHQYTVSVIGERKGSDVRFTEIWHGKSKGEHELIEHLVQKRLIGQGIRADQINVGCD